MGIIPFALELKKLEHETNHFSPSIAVLMIHISTLPIHCHGMLLRSKMTFYDICMKFIILFCWKRCWNCTWYSAPTLFCNFTVFDGSKLGEIDSSKSGYFRNLNMFYLLTLIFVWYDLWISQKCVHHISTKSNSMAKPTKNVSNTGRKLSILRPTYFYGNMNLCGGPITNSILIV